MKFAFAIAILLLVVLAGYYLFQDRFRPAPTAHLFAVAPDFNAIGSALKGYKLDNGHYPSTEQGLAALPTKSNIDLQLRTWTKGMNKIPLDPWDHEYRYRLLPDGKDFELRSAGPDGVFGTKDDISSLDE